MKTFGMMQILVLVMSLHVYSQKTITGVVKDSKNSVLHGVYVLEKGTMNGVYTDKAGKYSIEVSKTASYLIYTCHGFEQKEIAIGASSIIDVNLTSLNNKEVAVETQENIISEPQKVKVSPVHQTTGKRTTAEMNYAGGGMALPCVTSSYDYAPVLHNTEGYSKINDNGFKNVKNEPLSTFSIDVDRASYTNVRRFLNYGSLPPKDAVRVEEMINYFNYSYNQPKGEHPFNIEYQLSSCPWNEKNLLLHIGIQGKIIPNDNLPPSNLIFLIDISGSMYSENKLPLLKSAFKLLVQELRPQDRVAIVVYASGTGVVLPSTSGSEKQTILAALDKLEAGGSTAGAKGLELAYRTAESSFINHGNNRIILATDGDFNLGQSSNAEMERLIEREREKGIFISVLGFGMGNYKDDKMEIIADKGNGNYAYIDNLNEAKKVFVNEFGGTLFTIAKDVKIQIEFNPSVVAEYRLVGYENRVMANEDFSNDKKDAGDLGSGHSVTAMYEIIPKEGTTNTSYIPLRYQHYTDIIKVQKKEELASIKFRYKKPDSDTSILMEQIIANTVQAADKTSDNLKFAAAVAMFGMLLRDSEFKGTSSYEKVISLAQAAKGKDTDGYRTEFIQLVKSAQLIKPVSYTE
ncbi:MAG: von Willebrand factor type A domain-containing protein [Bacteroidales bacterium]